MMKEFVLNKMKKQKNTYNATFYTLVALGLLITSFFYGYPTNLYFILGAIAVGFCAYYWIYMAWKRINK